MITLGGHGQLAPTHKPTKAPKAKAKAKAAAPAGDLDGGTLGGIDWHKSESRDELYQFAKEQGLAVKSRMNKSAIIKALSDATKAE
jgi:hypothetical protein